MIQPWKEIKLNNSALLHNKVVSVGVLHKDDKFCMQRFLQGKKFSNFKLLRTLEDKEGQ